MPPAANIATTYSTMHTGTSRATAGPGETFSRGPSGDNIFEFFFLKWRIVVYFVFLSDSRAPNVARSGVTYPHPLDGPASTTLSVTVVEQADV